MTTPFQSQIHKALANPDLQIALDGNAERRIRVRKQAFTTLQDPAAMRQRAHQVRADVIAHLDLYIEQFARQAQQNGMRVHHAADAADALKVILEITNLHKAKLVAKSKTMLGEEIELNHALEKAGLKVVETDLGEYIVQLRGERPAHIITPAVHLRRADVGQTFHEKLGEPLTEDIPTMTAAARRVLRDVFLKADIGITGVNFGVVETGTLCILTNEGNGRMVTTVPPVHIALMGIERLVPCMDDLALMLKLLPRSATGQKLTVYTNLLHGPRRAGESDGPLERHLILIDNGRRRISRSSLAEILYCIRCGSCLNACPVFRELGGHAYVGVHGSPTAYPGPIGSVLSPALFNQNEFSNLARASSLCGACKEACPVDIDLPKLLLRIRAGGINAQPKPTPANIPFALKWGVRAFSLAASHPVLFSAAQKLAGAGGRLLAPTQPWLRLPALTGWGYSKDFPRPAGRSFQSRWSSQRHAAPVSQPAQKLDSGKNAAQGSRFSEMEKPDVGVDLSLCQRFAIELESLGGQVIFCQPENLVSTVLSFLKERGITTLLSWEAGSDSLPNSLIEALQEARIKVTHTPDAHVQAGLTGAAAAVAETGSVLVHSGLGMPLTASLLPEIHLVVLREEQISAEVAEVLANISKNTPRPAALALISGPSRTADIEMTLTIGVHGPREIHVFCICKSQ
jgi:L-lactate dehydrogenase complex protein LldF